MACAQTGLIWSSQTSFCLGFHRKTESLKELLSLSLQSRPESTALFSPSQPESTALLSPSQPFAPEPS